MHNISRVLYVSHEMLYEDIALVGFVPASSSLLAHSKVKPVTIMLAMEVHIYESSLVVFGGK